MSHDDERHEADRVRAGRIAATGLVGLLLFGAGALWAATVQVRANGSVRTDASPKPARAGQPEVGMVYQRPFDEREQHGIAATKNAAAQGRLDGLGWVNQDAGVAHIPIDDAIDLVVREGTR